MRNNHGQNLLCFESTFMFRNLVFLCFSTFVFVLDNCNSTHSVFSFCVCFELYFAMIIPKINTFVLFIINLSWYGQFVFFDFRLAWKKKKKKKGSFMLAFQGYRNKCKVSFALLRILGSQRVSL